MHPDLIEEVPEFVTEDSRSVLSCFEDSLVEDAGVVSSCSPCMAESERHAADYGRDEAAIVQEWQNDVSPAFARAMLASSGCTMKLSSTNCIMSMARATREGSTGTRGTGLVA